MAREIGKFKTLKGVVKDAAGKPIVTVLPDGQFDVLCNGNNGDCKGCVYKRNGWRCGAMCRDKDHIHFIHNRFLGDILTKNKRVKRAQLFDRLITEDGERFAIMYRSDNECRFEVIRDLIGAKEEGAK